MVEEKGSTHRQPKTQERGDMEPEIWDEKENEMGVPDISQNSIIAGGYGMVYITG